MFIYLSIDPGTNSLGITINGVDFRTKEKQVLHSTTVHIDKLAEIKYGDTIVLTHGLRYAKVHCCYEVVLKFLIDWNIQAVVSESPYMGRFPQAFGALVECVQAMRNAVFQYNPYLTFNTIDPATIKKSLGVKGNSGDKNAMTVAVGNMLNGSYDIQYLDEHAIDSIAVGHAWYLMSLLPQLGN